MDLAAEFEAWMQAHPNATNTEIAMAMEAAGVSPEELGAALGIDPAEARTMYDSALANPLLSEPSLEIPPEPAPIADQPVLASPSSNGLDTMRDITTELRKLDPGIQLLIQRTSPSAATAFDGALRSASAMKDTFSPIGLDPGSLLFSAFLHFMGRRGGKDWSGAVEATPEIIAQSMYDMLQQSSAGMPGGPEDVEGRDAQIQAIIQQASDLGLPQIIADLANQPEIAGLVKTSQDAPPAGYVWDEQGHLRDTATGSYWTLMGDSPIRATPPLVPVPMPSEAPQTPSGGASGGGDSNVQPTAPELTPYDLEHPWVYSSGKLTNSVTGEVVDAPTGVAFEEGGKYSKGNWGTPSVETPAPVDWAGIFGESGVQGVLDKQAETGATVQDISTATGVPVETINQTIADFQGGVTGGGVTGGAGNGGVTGGGSTPDTSGGSTTGTGGVTNNTTNNNTTNNTTNTTNNTTNTAVKLGLMTSFINQTPLTNSLFPHDTKTTDPKLLGLFDRLMGTRK